MWGHKHLRWQRRSPIKRTRRPHHWDPPRFLPLFYEPVHTVHSGPSCWDGRHFKVATRVNFMAAVLYDLPVVGSIDQSLWGSPLSPCVAVASAAPSPPKFTHLVGVVGVLGDSFYGSASGPSQALGGTQWAACSELRIPFMRVWQLQRLLPIPAPGMLPACQMLQEVEGK